MALIDFDAAWDWQQVALPTLTDPSLQHIPTTGWQPPAKAPFGTLGTLSPTALGLPINSAWATGTGLWLRKTVTLDGGDALLLSGQIKNAFYLFFDGEFIGYWNLNNPSTTDVVPWRAFVSGDLASKGTHTICIFVLDQTVSTGYCYVSCKVETCPPIAPVLPEAGARETLEWKTDVLQAANGTEQRLQLRSAPRQQLTYSHPMTPDVAQIAANILRGSYADMWLIPVWPQAQRLGSLATGALSATFDGTLGEFRANSVALLFNSSDDWQLVGVQAVSPTVITFCNVVAEDFSGAWLIPVRTGRIIKDPTKTTSGYGATFEVAFEVSDNAALPTTGGATFEGDDLSTDEFLKPGDALTSTIHRAVDVQDEGLGQTFWHTLWARSQVTTGRAIVAADAAEAWAFRQWLHRRAGCFRPFWEPSFEDDLRIANGAGTTIVTTVDIYDNDFSRYAGGSQTVAIAIETDSGWVAARTIAWERHDDFQNQIRLSFGSALNIPVDSIHRVCYLGLKRLESDRVELRWVGNGVLQAEFNVVELLG